MNYNNLCYQCFCEKPIKEKPCSRCGYKHTPNSSSVNCLTPGTLLNNRYIVGVALGVGGFGITYKCLDTKIGGICAIKEYFPAKFALRTNATKYVIVEEQNISRYNNIMNRFVEEADMVKKLNHKNIITIYDSFFENNTAYYVMEYCDGIDLRRYTANFSRKLNYDEGMNILYQVMNGLEYIHKKGILHRDIAPDNIYITKNNNVKILDFGSARKEMDQYNRELSVIVKMGYAPIEQYGGRGKQGDYTDIYALGATFYHLFTSVIPIESTQRVSEDLLVPFSQLRPDLPDNLKYCIERAMGISSNERIHDISEMKSVLGLDTKRVNEPLQQCEHRMNEKKKSHSNRNDVSMQSKQNNKKNNEVSKVFRLTRASIGIRVVAYEIDLIIWGVIYFSVLFGVMGINSLSLAMSFLFPIVFTTANTVLELACSTTIGKALMKMKIYRINGTKLPPEQILLRNLVKLSGLFVLLFAQNDMLLDDLATNSIVCVRE